MMSIFFILHLAPNWELATFISFKLSLFNPTKDFEYDSIIYRFKTLI